MAPTGPSRLPAASRLLAAAALLASCALAAAAPGTTAAPGDRLAAISAMGSRAEGAPGEAAAFAYIRRELAAAGLAPASSGFLDAAEGYSTSRIVEARLAGVREDELAVVLPVGSWIDAKDPSEGAYGLALALDEAERLSRRARAGSPLGISIRFVFLGAEKRGREADGEAASLGSRTWIARQAGRSRLAVLYLDLGAAPARVSVHSAGEAVLSPYWFYEGVRRSLGASGMAYGLEANRLQAYRLGLASDFGPAAPYLEAGIPAIELRGDEGEPAAGPPSAAISPAAGAAGPGWLGAFVDGFAREEAAGFADTWDRHYFIFQLGSISAVLRERSYVAFLVIAFGLVASSLLVATIARRNAAKLLLRRVPAVAAEILALFAALALVFLAGKGIAAADAAAMGSGEAWRLSPRLFAAARILFSFLLFLSILSFLVERRALTPNPYFYEFAALVCLAVDSLVFSAADLSASFYFIWALVLVEISLAARRRWATLVAYALMYVPLIVIAGELAIRPEVSAYRGLIAPEYIGLLSLSAITLPFFVFTASPLLFFAPPGAAARKRAAAILLACALAVEAAALAYAFFASPASGPERGDLTVSELVDQDAGTFELELSGLRRLGRGSIGRGGASLDYDAPGDRAYFRGPDRRDRIGLVEKASPFLDRVDEAISLRFSTPPYRVDLRLESAADLLIYDSSLPCKVAVDGRSAMIYAGVNPGARLDLSLTVPSSFRSRLVVTARYLSSPDSYTQSSGAPLADAGLAVKASFAIGSGPR